jgi:hypothetical protein
MTTRYRSDLWLVIATLAMATFVAVLVLMTLMGRGM